jgi:hypothetical protein
LRRGNRALYYDGKDALGQIKKCDDSDNQNYSDTVFTKLMNHLVRGIGMFLLIAGWLLMLAAVVLLNGRSSLPLFGVCAFGVQALGLTMMFRTHRRL